LKRAKQEKPNKRSLTLEALPVLPPCPPPLPCPPPAQPLLGNDDKLDDTATLENALPAMFVVHTYVTVNVRA